MTALKVGTLVAAFALACHGPETAEPNEQVPPASESLDGPMEEVPSGADSPDDGISGGQSGGESGPTSVPVSPFGSLTWGGLARGGAGTNPELLIPQGPLSGSAKLQWFDGVLYALEDGKVSRLESDALVPVLQMDVLGYPNELQVLDLDSDGQPEIVRHNDEQAWIWGGPDGYELQAELSFASTIGLSRIATWQDLDADGLIDLLVVEGSTLRWFKGGAELSLVEQSIESSPDAPSNVDPTWVEVSDLDDDGDRDVIVLFRVSSWGEGQNRDSFAAVFVNEGDDETFTFQSSSLAVMDSVAAARPLRDVDSDGLADLVWAKSGSLWFSRGLADARFAPAERIFTDAYQVEAALRAEDLDGDGKTDLLVRNGRSVSQLFNLGETQFEHVPLPRNLGRTVNVEVVREGKGPALLYATVEAESENPVQARCEDEPSCTCSFDTYCVACLDDSACENGECFDGLCVECDESTDCAAHEACLGSACQRVVSSDDSWSAVTTSGQANGCGIREGQIACWERSGQLIDSPLVGDFVQVVVVGDETLAGCGLTGDGQVACWSGDELWQPNLSEGEVAELAAGRAVCARHTTGTISCFFEDEVWPSASGSGFTSLAVSGSHACALGDNGSAECWSLDAPLSGGPDAPAEPAPEVPMSAAPQAQPLDVPDLDFSAICAGEEFSCGIKSEDGSITCWGRNDYAQTFAPAGSYTAIACGSYLSCALNSLGDVQCWGRAAWTPIGSEFVALSVAGDNACATRADGHFECSHSVP